MIVFGGQNGSGSGGATYPEVWVLSNANGLGGTPNWIKLAPTGGPPPGQYAPSAVYDPIANRMTVFGGGAQGTGLETNAVWVLSNANGLGGTAAWTNLIAEGAVGSPSALAYHSAIRDAASNRMTIFGGNDTDVWVLTNANGLGGTSAWMELAPTGGPPAARCCHAAVYDPATNRMTIFAGSSREIPYPYLNDTWVLKLNEEPPVSAPNGPYLGAVDVTIDFDGTASSDPDGDPLSYDWDWGDTTASPDAGATPTHAYDAAGIYDVCLTVTDPYGKSDTACAIAVVYDPAGGFVTGGGWIDSPQGAYVPDPSLTGKATFGFVSKYKKGATIPTGNTEFQFKTADLNFHSDIYEWLVVTGSDYAKFKGVGTINGAGEYRFQIWAGDGDPDTFRIKIWTEDETTGVEAVLYDNGFDRALGGGSIIVHTKK